ncbi:MAG: methyltransferase domain-containing protein [Rhodospirillaceae bacterium]|jgi:SAM-dependent methyltransferase|nr:methyltransferase domain-containing protein [Rhodospirillaceae bacterium]MBT4588514.1 methyltransferase domain-containing protein [Rhodospirillaceae bacterium]MBT4939245.1 methyltransferase domain-containing protein [Rhodospirillaceae bacterium]MBT5939359.1 methyltransferase domain-containing protein [Rhodospirillaceae bacterium]MBT7266404.1 methyltransferase domain-containing protein [Rhodospirillaceae bacterium]
MLAIDEFDTGKAEAFEERMVDILNAGAINLMISVGHRTGLFDVMAKMEAATSQEIADRAKLNERYVREWLGAMTASGFVTVDTKELSHGHDHGHSHYNEAAKFSLPTEHATCLTRAAAPNNIAVFSQYIAILGGVEDDIVECFEQGGGVPYEKYGRFNEVMAEDSGQTVLPALHDHILPLIPGLIGKLKEGVRMLDAGCGRGRAITMLAKDFPNSTFVGYDLLQDVVDFGNAEAERLGLYNLSFVQKDLTSFDDDADEASFDFVTSFDAIHDQADPGSMLRGIRKTLAEDGVYLAQDINGSSHVGNNMDHPIGPLLYTISCMHCMSVSLAQEGGEGLGAMWGREKAQDMFEDAGFDHVDVHELEHDIQNCYYVVRP